MLKKFMLRIISVLLIISPLNQYVYATCGNAADKLVIYVSSSDGSDLSDGSLSAPMRTLEGARNKAIKECRVNNFSAIDIVLREGVYERNKTFCLDKTGGGTDTCPVTYRGYAGENAVISGSISLDSSVVQKVYDRRILGKLAEKCAYDKLYVIDANLLNITLSNELMIGEERLPYRNYGSRNPIVMINGEAGHVARWPDNGYVGVRSVISGGTVGKSDGESEGAEFELFHDRAKYWLSDTAYMYGRYKTGWQDQTLPVVSADTEKRTVKTSDSPKSGAADDAVSVYFYNIFEEISQNGEYYADIINNKIYFCADNIDNLRLITLDKALVELKDVSNVTFSNITFDGALNNGIEISGCENVLFDNCIVKNIGARSVIIDNGSKNCGIRSSKISNVFDGIYINGGDPDSLTPGNNCVENCVIDNFGGQCYARGAAIGGVGNRISGCTFKNSENMAVQLSGVSNVIEYCEFTDVLRHTGDMGVIYAGDGWSMRGNKITNNYFHDIYSEKEFMLGTRMIYLDLSSSGVTISGNVFEKTSGQAIVNSCGMDNKIFNNIFVKCSTAVCIEQYAEYNEGCADLYRSISKYSDNDAWISAFPEVKRITDSTYKAERLRAENNIFADSTYLNYNFNNITDSEIEGIENNYITNTTSIFEDYEKRNFKIKSDDVKSKLIGYKDIDTTKCGSGINDESGGDSDIGSGLGEVVVSCGFEDGTADGGNYDDSANGEIFISVNNDKQKIELDDSIAHGGRKSILIETPSYTAPCVRISADTNTLYKISVQIHADAAADEKKDSLFGIMAHGSNAVYSTDKNAVYRMHGYETQHHSEVTKDKWTLLERYFICPSDENKRIDVELGVYSARAGGTVRYNLDDLKVSRMDDSAVSAEFIAGCDTIYSSDRTDAYYTAAMFVGGNEIYDTQAIYSLKSSTAGVSIDQRTGKLTVAEGTSGNITVTAAVSAEGLGRRVCEKNIRILNGKIPKLDSVYLNGTRIDGFSPNKYDYYNQPCKLTDSITAESEDEITRDDISGIIDVIRLSVFGESGRTVYNFYPAKESAGENEVSDGGFESGVNDILYPKSAVNITDEECRSGAHCAAVKLGRYETAYSTVYAEKDKLYIATMWVKLKSEKSVDAVFFSAFDGYICTDSVDRICEGGMFADNNTNYMKQTAIYSDKWVRLKRIFFAENSGPINVGIGYYGENLECLVDDIYISELVNGDRIKDKLKSNESFYELCIQNLNDCGATVTVVSRAKAENGCLMSAAYEDSTLVGLDKFDIHFNAVEVIDLRLKDDYKIFLWQDLEDITPLTQNISKTTKEDTK